MPGFRLPPRTRSLAAGLSVLLLLAGAWTAAAATRTVRIQARAAGAYDLTRHAWMFDQNVDDTLSVASITKIAAALTFMEMAPDLDAPVTIRREDWVGAGKTKLRVGDRVPARTLLRLALVASDNCAARALAHPFALDPEGYAYRMTLTARRLGCRVTRFTEPTGLDAGNISTAREVVVLFRAALEDPLLGEFLGTTEFVLETGRGPRPIVHSSRSLRYRDDIGAAKTGYTDAAGYCLVQVVRDEAGDFITVVLGARSRSGRNIQSTRVIDHVRWIREEDRRS